MKTIKKQIQKTSRPGVILLATVVVIITSICVVNATQTITTPNAAFISYNLAASANSAAITPATNRPVLVMGCCTHSSLHPGVGEVSLQHIPGVAMAWVGLESEGPAGITYGYAAPTGTHIVYIDGGHTVDIQVNSADTIRVHNGSASTAAGNVTLVW
jgi:hypothetical protein